jgi:hypothetical protein
MLFHPARFQASGSVRSCIWPCSSHSRIAPVSRRRPMGCVASHRGMVDDSSAARARPYFPFAFTPPAADAYSRIAFSRSVGTACRLSCSARFAISSADRAVLFRAFECSRDSPLFLFWLKANPYESKRHQHRSRYHQPMRIFHPKASLISPSPSAPARLAHRMASGLVNLLARVSKGLAA